MVTSEELKGQVIEEGLEWKIICLSLGKKMAK